MTLYKNIVLTIGFFAPLITFGQDTLTRTGKYSGKDIYVQNPSLINKTDTLWTAKKVFVNNNLVLSGPELNKSAFSIPLTKLNFKTGDNVTIKIIQAKTGRQVKILNP
jgi:hypothetical protein